MRTSETRHLLEDLQFPHRYEGLVKVLGKDVAQLIVAPPQETLDTLEVLGHTVRASTEGQFVPVYAPSGTGKTTMVENLGTFFQSDFTPTARHEGPFDAESLKMTASRLRDNLDANDERVIPVNIDHRETDPPTATELANVKRFLRDPDVGFRTLVLWPETSEDIARQMSAEYEGLAGNPPIDLPFRVQGPARAGWPDIAIATLRLVNRLDNLELLGIDPRDYDPDEHHTIGEYLRSIGRDFVNYKLELLRETREPLHLAIVFCSKTPDAGVLVHVTTGTRFGFLDGDALIASTSDSEVGRWWNERRGLLTRTIVQLEARALAVPPSVSVPIFRRFGPPEVATVLDEVGVRDRGPAALLTTMGRSDLGKFLQGTAPAAYETRGTPATTADAAFELVGDEVGFGGGTDKKLNAAMAEAIDLFGDEGDVGIDRVAAETGLGFVPLLPDNAIHTERGVTCIEYAWRSGDYLTKTNRGDAANYILTKLRNYARELGWY